MSGCKCLFIVLAVIGLGLIIVISILGFRIFDDIMYKEIQKQVRLEHGTVRYERWKELPFALTFKVYLFNVTNPDDILNGKKPVVHEVGPYVYSLRQKKHSIDRNKYNDTLFYYQNQLFEFNAEQSAPRTEDDTLIVLFAPYYGVIQSVESFIGGIFFPNIDVELARAFPSKRLFSEITVKNYLFDGYTFCTGLPGQLCPLVELGSDQVRTMEVVEVGENKNAISFSFLSYKNNTHDESYKIVAGMDNINNLGLIMEWENNTILNNVWQDNSSCNVVTGRDSTIYPPYIKKEDSFDIFSSDICRVVTLEYVGEEEYMGIKGQRRELKRDTLSNKEKNECYCVNVNGGTKPISKSAKCLPDGFMDLYTCTGASVILSLPHFLWADKEYASTVDGLNPNIEEHASFVVLEPGTGTPLRGAKRVQFNMILRNIEEVTELRHIQPAVIPLMWVEEGTELPEKLVKELKSKYLNKLFVATVVIWVLIGLGIALLVVFSICFFCKR